MNWSQIQTLFDGQGIVFWGALAAVALGLTLLSVSIFFQVRKMLAGTRFLRRRSAAATAANNAATVAPPRIKVTEDGYEASGFVPNSVPTAAPETPTADPMLANLLARLKSSADRLDRIHSSIGPNSTLQGANADSPLKAISEEVDYIYKTGRA